MLEIRRLWNLFIGKYSRSTNISVLNNLSESPPLKLLALLQISRKDILSASCDGSHCSLSLNAISFTSLYNSEWFQYISIIFLWLCITSSFCLNMWMGDIAYSKSTERQAVRFFFWPGFYGNWQSPGNIWRINPDLLRCAHWRVTMTCSQYGITNLVALYIWSSLVLNLTMRQS